jgi:hypothetical protein
MDISDWVALLAMVASILLFLMVLLRISRVSKERRSDQKLMRLHEIEDWAREVISCGFSDDLGQVKDIEQLRSFTFHHLGQMRHRFVAMGRKGRRMREIARVFGEDLQQAISLLVERLGNHISVLSECMNSVPTETAAASSDFDAVLAKTTASEAEVIGSAYGVIEAVTRNRTNDIADTGA